MSLTKAEEKVFFASKPNKPHRVTMGGKKLSLANMPKEIQDKVKKVLAEKDEVMAKGLAGEIPGLKIDGRQVTRDNIHEFEKGFKKDKKAKKSNVKSEKKSGHSEEELKKLSFSKLKKLAKSLGETGRSKFGLIKDILKHQ